MVSKRPVDSNLKIAQHFSAGSASTGCAKSRQGRQRTASAWNNSAVLSSLRDLHRLFDRFPALKCWAIFKEDSNAARPEGLALDAA
jgi:hypothetical protein